MDLLMVAAELSPYARATAAADSIAALAKALRQLGHTVTVALPHYESFDTSGLLLARRLTPLVIEPGWEVSVLDAQLPTGVGLVLFDAPEFDGAMPGFGAPGTPEGETDGRRFALLSRAAAAFVRERAERGSAVDVVHLHDWPAAPVAALLSRQDGPPTVLTLHREEEERVFAADSASLLGDVAAAAEVGGRVSYVRLGIASARAVTTVSPSYARALLEGPLASVFAAGREPPLGILEGVDYAVLNPATDSALENRFDAEDPSGKARGKGAVLRSLELDLDIERPLFLLSLLGVDAAAESVALGAAARALDQDLALILLGGSAEAALRLAEERRGDLAVVPAVADGELRRLIAAADFVVTVNGPSPMAHLELAAQRYGAFPIAEATGGVPDAVIDADAELETGSGFLYAPKTQEALLGAMQRALSAYRHPSFARLRRRMMRADVGWDRPARRYAQLYKRVLGEPSIA